VVAVRHGGTETVLDGLRRPQGILVHDAQLYVVDADAKELVVWNLDTGVRRTIASELPVGAPPAWFPRRCGACRSPDRKGRSPVSRPGRTARCTCRPTARTACLRLGGKAIIMPDTRPADHLYLQVARTLRKEIADGVYAVQSQLPIEHGLSQHFSVSRYTVREALRRLRDGNLVSSRPGTGTLLVPRASAASYVQDVVSIDDLRPSPPAPVL
jgi:DNA-binding transcriptional regulator YhcF (GntR family)